MSGLEDMRLPASDTALVGSDPAAYGLVYGQLVVLWAVWRGIMRGTPQICPARLNHETRPPTPPGVESWAARPVPRRCLAKALTNSTWLGLFEAGEALLSLCQSRNLYLLHKVLPLETEDHVVGVPGTSKSAGGTSYGDVTLHQRLTRKRKHLCCNSSNTAATTS